MRRFKQLEKQKPNRMLQPQVIKVVLDTNIVVSAIISADGNPAKIIEKLFLEEIENYTMVEIIDEIREVLERPKISDRINPDIKEFTLSNFEVFSEVIMPLIKLNKVPDDPDDNKFLECAITANVQYIVSGDSHLLDLKEFMGIKIVTPLEFIEVMNARVSGQESRNV